jgi:hypothetical protein
MPTGTSDPKVAWGSPAEETAFFNFAAANGLNQWAGQVIPRNAVYAPWEKTFNLHFEQEIPIYKPAKFVVFLDCLNFANLLNKNWGIETVYDFPWVRSVAGTGYNPAGNGGAGQYVYVFNSSTLGTSTTYSDESRWSINLGAKLEF